MADGNVSLSAAERRERRLKRILGDGENRIRKILSGPDGGEQRLPPMLEGGEYKSSLLYSGEEPLANSERNSDGAAVNKSPAYSCMFLSRIKQMDIPLTILYGIFVHLFMLKWTAFNILLPWFLLFFSTRFSLLVNEGPKFISDIKVALHSKDISAIERIMHRSSSVLNTFHVFTSRLVVLVTAFLVTCFVVIITSGTYNDTDSIFVN